MSSSDTLPSIAASRATEPVKLMRLVRGELDWIVMKALEKDRSRRYETANGFAMDIQRYLADEPVLASPPSAVYRLRKMVSRRPSSAALAVCSVLLALVVGVLGTTAGLPQAVAARQAEAEQRQLAEQERDEKEKARADAVDNENKAKEARAKEEAQRKQAEAVANLLESLFRGLGPNAQQKGEADLRAQLVAQLDFAAANLEKEYAGQPLMRARLRQALGATQLNLGEVARAEKLLREAVRERRAHLGADHVDMPLTSPNSLAEAYRAAGRYGQAIKLLRGGAPAADEEARPGPPRHPDHSERTCWIVQVRRPQQRSHRAVRTGAAEDDPNAWPQPPRHAQSDEQPWRRLPGRGPTRRGHQDFRAGAAGEQSKVRGPDHPDTLGTMHHLAAAYRIVGRTKEAMDLYEQTYRLQSKKLGPDHPETLTTGNNLAVMYRAAGRADEAIKLLEEIHDRIAKKLGVEHPDTLLTRGNLAVAYQVAGRVEQAIKMLEELRPKMTKQFGPDDTRTSITIRQPRWGGVPRGRGGRRRRSPCSSWHGGR